jgi:Cu(I)/Ag(I) efflux system membrane protein CusA/SilA
MFARIIQWSIHNKFLVLLSTVFLIAAGLYSVMQTPLDAIPDLSDVQVIVYTEYPGQAPQIVEDQVTYPLTTQMLSVPYAKVVRGYSFFGFSFVYIIFDDGTDLYWARSRVLESLNYVSGRLPKGVTPTLGPDATGVGWAFMYALKSDRHDLSQLRSIQDWYLKYGLTGVPGVSEVASIGGYVKQYQVTVDPNKLRGYNIPISKVRVAIQRSNNDVGGRLLEVSEKEFMIRGLGYIKSLADLDKTAVGVDRNGTPILLKDIATVQYGPEIRRGLAELDGQGETVGGIVVVRFGANARQVIQDIKAKLADLKKGLPEGVQIQVAYDRSELIERAVETLKGKLLEESIVVAVVCVIFLLHFRSALVAIITLPVAILMAFIVMHQQGINANIMSLGGIAIAIGAMVDAAIIMIENAHKHMERDSGKKPHWDIISDAASEVGPALFYSLLVIAVSFVPVFTLEAREGRLFKPLAFTKTYSMAAAALLSVTLVPVLMGYFIRGKLLPEHRNPINRFLVWMYHPILEFALRFKYLLLGVAVLAMAITVIPFQRLGSEFMPSLWEGDLLYMPTMLPGVSITKAREVLQQTDKIIKTFPEVDHVFGKVGRAETATDPAPLSMIETTITLKPESQWPKGMTVDKLTDAMNAAIQIPGVTNAWTMPIKTRTDMLSTGIKTPVGIKLAGPDLNKLEKLGKDIEAVMRDVPGTLSVYAERVMGGNYLDFSIDRDAIARYGLTVGDVQDVIQTAIGGMDITTTVEGLERYPVNLRYSRDFRDDIPSLESVLVPTPAGQQIPLGQLASVKYVLGPPAIKSEGARPNAWIYVDLRGIDVGTYVQNAQKVVAEKIKLPTGYTIAWSGQYEYMQRAKKRLMYVIPLTIVIIFVIIFLNTKSLIKTAIVFLGIPGL